MTLAAVLSFPCADMEAQRATGSVSAQAFRLVRPRYSGERARATVAFLDQYVRWPGNRGFDASIAHIAQQLQEAGYVPEDRARPDERLVYRIERYPMSTPAWEPVAASVAIAGERDSVLTLATNRNMLATESFATAGGGVAGTLVDAGSGMPRLLDSLDVKGKIVLADLNVGRLFAEAVTKRGALGVLGYSMPEYTQPAKNRTSIQFGAIPRDTLHQAWGISLSWAARQRLRAALSRGPVTLRVSTDVRWTVGATEQTVVADVRGSRVPNERFVFSAHLQEPGANDNASGVGAQTEMARLAAQLVRTGEIDPRRTITFLWGLEIQSTARYITQDSARARGIRWGVSLDMVGEDTRKTGGAFLIEKMPDPSAIWTRGDDRHTEWGGSPLTKSDMAPHYLNDFVLQRCLEQASTNGWTVKTNPFEGGSDHTPFLTAKKPGLLFWHFTDQFYHTDGDRMPMVSADELRNVGVSALVSAIVLTSANGATARAVVGEVASAAHRRLATERALGVAAVATGGDITKEQEILTTWGDWYDGALAATAEIEVGGASAATQRTIETARAATRTAVADELARLSAASAKR